MKIKILMSLVLSSILFSSHVSASAMSAAADYISEHPEKVARAKEVLKFGFKKAPKGAAVVIAGKTAKTVVEHPFLAAGGVAAYATYKIFSVDNAVYQIARQPEALDNYLEKNPNKIDEFSQKTIEKYNNSNNNDKALYAILLEKLGYDIISDNQFDSVNLKTKQEQDNLENTPDFVIEENKLIAKADYYDSKIKNICSLSKAINMIKMPPKIFYEETKKDDVPELVFNEKYSLYSVGQFSKFLGKLIRTNGIKSDLSIERDHIPSYKALELFFLKKYPLLINEKKIDGRYANLNNNATIVNIYYNMHLNNRTSGDRNKFYSIIDSVDSLSLRIATIKDFATLRYLSRNDKIEYDKLLISFEYVYERSKRLCLYDI